MSSCTAPQLGAITIKESLDKAGVVPEEVSEVYMGTVLSAGVGQAPARQAAMKAGLPWSVPCTTVNKVCASGTKATMIAAQTIMSGINQCVISGGMESMSNVPYYLPKGRNGQGFGHGQVLDGIIKDGLWDAFDDQHMGMCAEACSTHFNITREEQDAFALESYRRAAEASNAGLFKEEIVGIEVKSRKASVVVDEDEEFGKLVHAKVPTLKPAFKPDGTVTAANASSLNDGAASLVLAAPAFAVERNLTPLGRIVGMADAAQQPIDFTTSPALVIPMAIANAGLTAADIDVYEINEAFSVVALANMRLLDLDPAWVNVHGGAVALGHPIGCSGARIIVTLLSVLRKENKRFGVAAICNGGGGASAVVVERLD